MKLPKQGLYAITDTTHIDATTMLAKTKSILEAGAKLLQYRSTETNPIQRNLEATQLSQLCRRLNVPLIINNDIELVIKLNADGIHLGKNDPSIAEARAMLDQHAIIGYSCYNDLSRASDALDAGADYLAFGACFPSPSKPEAIQISPAIIKQAKQILSHPPIVAIGGITPENGALLIEAGADMLAVISGLYRSKEPFDTATKYINLFP